MCGGYALSCLGSVITSVRKYVQTIWADFEIAGNIQKAALKRERKNRRFGMNGLDVPIS